MAKGGCGHCGYHSESYGFGLVVVVNDNQDDRAETLYRAKILRRFIQRAGT